MTTSGEVPDITFSAPLSADALEIFRDQIVFPAVDHLAGAAFGGELSSIPGAEFNQNIRLPNSSGGLVRYIVEAQTWLNFCETEEVAGHRSPQKMFLVRLVIEEPEPELTAALIDLAKQESDGGDFALHDDSDEELSAWSVYDYKFSTERPVNGRRSSTLELQDGEGFCVWPEEDELDRPKPDDAMLTEEEKATLKIAQDAESYIDQQDKLRVIDLLARLGVPRGILFQ